MEFEKELEQAIIDFGLNAPEFEWEKLGNGKIGGVVLSDSFKDKEHMKRQKEIWDHLEESLGDEKIQRVSTLLLLTPEEVDFGE